MAKVVRNLRVVVRLAGLLVGMLLLTLGSPASGGVFSGPIAFTGDSDSGISSGKTYTHAVNFLGVATAVNGVPFISGPRVGANYGLYGDNQQLTNNGNNNATPGGIHTILNDFFYNGGPALQVLSGLTPGTTYTTTFYNAAYGGAGTRLINILASDGGSILNFDENFGGNGSPNMLKYTYTPTGTTIAYAFNPVSGGTTFHHYGFSNEVVAAGPPVASNRFAIPGLFNTGVDNSRALLPNSSSVTDPHYLLTAVPTGAGLPATPYSPNVEDATVFPIVAGPWLPNTSTARWIAPEFNTSLPNAPAGFYDYTMSFDLSGFSPSTAVITGDWATDNLGVSILVNGVSTGAATNPGFNTYTDFLINGTMATFLPGLNTITFHMENLAPAGYTGLLVDNLAGTAEAVPEPVSLLLLTGGLLALARRRRAVRRVAALIALVAVMGLPAHAAPIFTDAFNRTGNLDGSLPDTTFAGRTWRAPTSGATLNGSVAAMPGNSAAYLQFLPVSGGVYTLSVDATPPVGISTDWLALGYVTNLGATTGGYFQTLNNAAPWVLVREAGGVQAFAGPAANNLIYSGGGDSGGGSPTNLKLVLDTTGAAWKTSVFVNTFQVGSMYTYGSNPGIVGVAIGSGNLPGTFDNFSLSGPLPAPPPPPPVGVAIPGVFNTGVDNSHTPLPNNSSVTDPHYRLIVAGSNGGDTLPATPFPPHVEDQTVFPVGSAWLPNSSTAKWIAPEFNTGNAPGGVYEYQTTFDLTGFIPSTAIISGNWATDNEGIDVLVNGVSTGTINTAQFSTYTSFVIDGSKAPFLAGLNTLTFELQNDGSGYTALLVDNLQVTASPVPEPVSALLLAGGLLALARRRRAVRRVAATIALVAAMGLSAQAAPLLTDTFTRSGDLNGSAPDFAFNGATWTASGSTTNGSVANITPTNSAYLPTYVVNGGVYTFSVDATPPAGGSTNWLAMGFATSLNGPGQWLPNAINGEPWMLVRDNGDVQIFQGPVLNNAVYTGPGGTGGGLPSNLKIVLDTTNPNWSASVFVNSTLRATIPYTGGFAVTGVGIGNFSLASGVFDNFSLTGPDPTPVRRHYTMDDNAANTTVANTAAFGSNATYANGINTSARHTAGILGSGALTLNGTSDYIQVDNGTDLNFLGPFTISGWVKTTDLNGMILSFRTQGGSGNPLIEMGVWNGLPFGQVRDDNGAGLQTLNAGSAIDNNAWHQVAVRRRSDSIIELYADGMLVATGGACSGPITTSNFRDLGSEQRWVADGANSLDQQYLAGSIDDVGIWTTDLSPQMLALIHGLGIAEGLNLSDPLIGSVLSAYYNQSSVVLPDGDVWQYATGLSGGIGSMGLVNGEPFIVLGAGNGVLELTPEPATILVLAGGLLALARRRRRTA